MSVVKFIIVSLATVGLGATSLRTDDFRTLSMNGLTPRSGNIVCVEFEDSVVEIELVAVTSLFVGAGIVGVGVVGVGVLEKEWAGLHNFADTAR